MSDDFDKLVASWSPIYEDPKQIELVESITEKTRLGKIVWQSSPSSLVAVVPPMQMNFVRSTTVNALANRLLGGGTWDIFSIRRQDGTEILKVEQPSNLWAVPRGGASPPEPVTRSKLIQAVDSLYSIAASKGQGDIDNAINVIKNL
jgi:hypothetical protein